MRREGKAGLFIPCEVRAQTRPARATTLAVARRHRRTTTTVGAWAKAYPLGRRRLCPGGNTYTRARTHAPARRRVPHRRGVFSQTPQTSTLGRRRLRPSDNAYVRETTSGSCFSNVGIFLCFGNPNKTFPLSLFENYSNCIEDGNPKLFLLVGVFLSALNRDLAFLSRHLSI